jgi:hypothetical protein
VIGVNVSFGYAGDFDRARIIKVAGNARGMFEGMPGLRFKAFTFNEEQRRAANFYVRDSEEAARGFSPTSYGSGLPACMVSRPPSSSWRSPRSSTTPVLNRQPRTGHYFAGPAVWPAAHAGKSHRAGQPPGNGHRDRHDAPCQAPACGSLI